MVVREPAARQEDRPGPKTFELLDASVADRVEPWQGRRWLVFKVP